MTGERSPVRRKTGLPVR